MCENCERLAHERDAAQAFAISSQRETREVVESLRRYNSERDAAQADLTAARSEVARLSAEVSEEIALRASVETDLRETKNMCDGLMEAINKEAHARASVEAEAAAMREAVEDLFESYRGAGEEDPDLVVAYEVFKSLDAGRAIAARLPLLEETLTRIAEIFPQLQSNFIHGEYGSVAKLITALGDALTALDEKGSS